MHDRNKQQSQEAWQSAPETDAVHFRRNILRIVIIGVQGQYTTLHGIHNVGIGTLHNHVTDKTTAQLLHVSHNIEKSGQLIPVGKLAEDQQINNLFKAVTSAVQTSNNILYIDALVKGCPSAGIGRPLTSL